MQTGSPAKTREETDAYIGIVDAIIGEFRIRQIRILQK